MGLRSALRATPSLLRVGLADAVAYRAELLVWVLSTTMPLIMLALWGAVAEDAPIGRFTGSDFVAYFLATFIVRQLTGCWVSWQINQEVRDGTLAMRLVRPIHPLWTYAIEQIAVVPMRAIVSLPVGVIALVIVGGRVLPRDAATWGLCAVSLLGAWLITFFVQVAIGLLSLFIESSVKVMDIWLAGFFVMSGYLLPVELFPPAVRAVGDVLPFRYQIGLPVELMTNAHPLGAALALVGWQWVWVMASGVVAFAVYRGGVARFAAYGG